jgi:hypothetical protein
VSPLVGGRPVVALRWEWSLSGRLLTSRCRLSGDFVSSSAPFPSAAVMAEVAMDLDAPIGVEELLGLICLAAVDTVPGADYAGITLTDRDENLSTPAATDPLVQRLDALQYVLMEGPCLDAIHGDWESEGPRPAHR